MEKISLEVEAREELRRAKVKDIRDAGFIPAIIYAKGKKPQAIKASHRQLVRLVHEHHFENVVINLKLKEDKKERPCLVKDIQYDPVKGNILHVDFNEVSLTESIKVNVPVTAKGEPVGVKQEGGSLEHILWEIEIECLPTDIPKDIEVDVSQLKIGDAVHVRDIKVPANIKILHDLEATVISVAAPIKEEAPAEEAIEGAEKQEPEVIKEKKEVPGEAEAEGKKEK